MKTITTTIMPPNIHQEFNSLLLLTGTVEYYNYMRKKIVEMAKRKIREQDIGKLLQFKQLHDEFMEVYGRKTIEEKELKEAQSNNFKESRKMPTSVTFRFKRFQTI